MQKFTIKTVGKTNIYELDETKKTLLITRKKYGRTVRQENFDLQQLDPEYGEFAPETPRIFPLLLAWCVIILGFGLVGTVLFFALQSPWDKTLIGFIVFILAVIDTGKVVKYGKALHFLKPAGTMPMIWTAQNGFITIKIRKNIDGSYNLIRDKQLI